MGGAISWVPGGEGTAPSQLISISSRRQKGLSQHPCGHTPGAGLLAGRWNLHPGLPILNLTKNTGIFCTLLVMQGLVWGAEQVGKGTGLPSEGLCAVTGSVALIWAELLPHPHEGHRSLEFAPTQSHHQLLT